MKEKTLKQLREEISEQVEWLDRKEYAHNIIGLCLRRIDKQFGTAQANQAIIDLGLEDEGWKVEKGASDDH